VPGVFLEEKLRRVSRRTTEIGEMRWRRSRDGVKGEAKAGPSTTLRFAQDDTFYQNDTVYQNDMIYQDDTVIRMTRLP